MANERILIVDDNAVNAKLVCFLLASKGYDVRTVGSAEQAIGVIEEHRPRLILMDIQLPGMDGLTLTRRLKAAPETRDTIVLAVTAFAMKGDEQKALAAGCDGYMSKPIDTRVLPEIIAAHLGKSRSREPS